MSLCSPKDRLSQLNSMNQDQLRTSKLSVSNAFLNYQNTASQDKKKFIETLQTIAIQQKEKRQQMEVKYGQFKHRNLERENQFFRILAKLNTHIQNQSQQDIHITQIYQKILCTFQAFNQKVRQLLQDRYTQLYRLMERRVDILMQKMDKQLSKYRKLSEAELRQMRQEIKQTTVIAAEIQHQNIQIRRKNQVLQLKSKMLKQQKKLLLEDIAHKKAIITSERRKSHHPAIRNPAPQTNNTKQSSKQVNLNLESNMDYIQIQNPETIRFSQRRILTGRGNSHAHNFYNLKSRDNKTIQLGNANQQIMATVDKQVVVSVDKQVMKFKTTIDHLKNSLQREKKKNAHLVKFCLQLEAKQQRIKQIVNKYINSSTSSSQKSLKNSPYLKNSQVKNSKTIYQSEVAQKKSFSEVKNYQSQYNSDSVYFYKKEQVKTLKQMGHLSQILRQINKVLHLPQSGQVNAVDKVNFNECKQDEQYLSLINPSNKFYTNIESHCQKTPRNRNELSARYSTIDKTRKVPHKHSQKLGQTFTTPNKPMKRSTTYQVKSKSKRNSLFINYSPLDLIDIANSIQIRGL